MSTANDPKSPPADPNATHPPITTEQPAAGDDSRAAAGRSGAGHRRAAEEGRGRGAGAQERVDSRACRHREHPQAVDHGRRQGLQVRDREVRRGAAAGQGLARVHARRRRRVAGGAARRCRAHAEAAGRRVRQGADQGNRARGPEVRSPLSPGDGDGRQRPAREHRRHRIPEGLPAQRPGRAPGAGRGGQGAGMSDRLRVDDGPFGGLETGALGII